MAHAGIHSPGTLALGPGRRNAAAERFLREEEEDDHRQNRHGAGRHEVVPLHAAVLALVAGESDRAREGFVGRGRGWIRAISVKRGA